MSGFLHQLAARSLGLAPAARPRAALPYAAPAPETPAPDLAAVAPEAPAVVAAAPLPATWRDVSEPAAVLPAERHAAKATPASHAPAASTEIPARHSVALAPIVPRQRPEINWEGDHPAIPEPAIGELPAPTAAIPNARPPAIQAAADSRPASDEPTTGLLDLESLISRLVGQATSHAPLAPDGTPSPSTAIAPATGQPPRPGHTSHRPAERRESAETASPAADSAPEVHITIGRLEVNPPSRPTPPPPRPRGQAPLSLGDYLARRAGGRS
ncbi:MAG TPA: hypothetical protein VN627_10170 [Novosphingobium sp.]|nr:hypothetical protein [Novosphingobium sp.]